MLNPASRRCLVLAVALLVTAGACGYVPGTGPGPTHVAGTEDQPGPGSVLVEGAPARATRPLLIEFVAPDGTVVQGRTARIPTGGTIEASMTNLPGPMSIHVNGSPCEGDFLIEADRLTHVLLRADDAGCSVETTKIGPI